MALPIDPDAAVQYLEFVAERHRIWEKRQVGHPQPWTDDATLATRKFTNVYRVLDPGSQFVFDLDHPDPFVTLARLIGYRYTNLPSAWREFAEATGHYPRLEDWGGEGLFADFLMNLASHGVKTFSGAYIILPEPNHKGDKARQSCRLVERVMDSVGEKFIAAQGQQEKFDLLVSQFGVGEFLAYQILTDWGYTQHVDRDLENDFVVAGPGAKKGAATLLGIAHTEKKNWVVQDIAAETIRWAQKAVWDMPDCPTLTMPSGHVLKPSLQSIQNTFCEFSKYVKGPRKSVDRYVPLHPGPQPAPRFPASW